MSNSGTQWEYQAGWDEDNMTDQGMNSGIPLRQHMSDFRQRRTAVEQLVSHENPNRKEDERMGKYSGGNARRE